MKIISFDYLPQALENITVQIQEINDLLKKMLKQPAELPDELLTVAGAAEFLDVTIQTIYSKVSRGELPSMKRGKRLYFSRDELFNYLKEGKKNSHLDSSAAAETYLKQKGGAK